MKIDELEGNHGAIRIPTPRILCGVYFLYSKGVCVYVGKSNNVMSRITKHTTRFEFDSVSFIDVAEERLNEVEKHWIDKLQPKHNKMYHHENKNSWHKEKKRLKQQFMAECAACSEPTIMLLDIEPTMKFGIYQRGILTLKDLEQSYLRNVFENELNAAKTKIECP